MAWHHVILFRSHRRLCKTVCIIIAVPLIQRLRSYVLLLSFELLRSPVRAHVLRALINCGGVGLHPLHDRKDTDSLRILWTSGDLPTDWPYGERVFCWHEIMSSQEIDYYYTTSTWSPAEIPTTEPNIACLLTCPPTCLPTYSLPTYLPTCRPTYGR